MNIEELRLFCLSFKAVEESFPFDNDILAFKVMGKIFCLTNINPYKAINLKCNPEKAIELREIHPEVSAGFHMNKKHWNTIKITSNISESLLKKWITDSYNLVVKGLPRKLQIELQKN